MMNVSPFAQQQIERDRMATCVICHNKYKTRKPEFGRHGGGIGMCFDCAIKRIERDRQVKVKEIL